MIIDLLRLKSNVVNSLEIDEKYSFSSDELKGTQILQLDDVRVTGSIIKSDSNEYIINARVYGTMVLPCSLSLKPTDYHFDFEVSGNIREMLEEIGKNDKNLENSIDILPIIWENIVMEIPMRIVNEDVHDVKLEGEGWKVITEETTSVNPGLEKLKDLL